MRSKFPAAIPEIPVSAMDAAVDYYVRCLGFELDWCENELGLAGICSPDALAKTLGLEEEGVCGRCIRNIETLVALATREATLRGRSALFGKPD